MDCEVVFMRKIIIFASSIVILMLICGCSTKTGYGNVDIPDIDTIKQVQEGALRLDVKDEYPKYRLKNLVEDLEKAPPVNETRKDIKKGKDYLSVGLVYEDGSKDMFYFFEQDEKWYFETQDGYLYGSAEFIREDCDVLPKSEVSPIVLITDNAASQKIELELMKKLDELDLRFLYARNVLLNVANRGFSENEAIKKVEKELEEYWINNRYASLHGYELSDEELENEIQERIKEHKETEYYKNTGEKLYKEYETTIEECLEKEKEFIRGSYLKNKILAEKKNEFYDGKDTVGKKVCKSWDEYYQTFVNEVMRPEIDKVSKKELEQIMTEARAFYDENNLDVFLEEINELKEFTVEMNDDVKISSDIENFEK